jgi:hypothetical protein
VNPDPDPIRIQGFDDQKLKKKKIWLKFFFFYISKIAIYLSLGLYQGCPCYRRSLPPSKENIQHFNFFLFLRVIFAPLYPDPDRESGSGSRGPIESGSRSTTQHNRMRLTRWSRF